MTKVFLFLIISLTPYLVYSSGCFANAPFNTNSSCDSNNPNPLTVCFNAAGGLDLPGYTDVFWNFGDGTTSNQFDPCHTYTAAGTYTVYRRIDVHCGTWDFGCKLHLGFGSSASCDYTGEITIYDNNFASSLTISTICPDNIGTATFAPSSTDGVSWLWDPTNDDVYYNIGDNSLDGTFKPITTSATNLVFTSPTSGEHVLYYTYGASCEGIDTVDFDLVTKDSLLITQDYNGENVSCFESSDGQVTSYTHGGTQPITYTWDNGFVETNAFGFSINDNIPAGTYIVDITDADGCLAKDTITITEPTELLATAHVTPEVCGLPPILGDLEIDLISGGVPTYTVMWNTGSNQLILDDFPSATYTYIVTDLNGCEFHDTLVLYNSAKPIASFNVLNECIYDAASFQDLSSTSIGVLTNWNWAFDDGFSSTTQSPFHDYLVSGSYNPTLIVTNSDNCKDTVSNPLTMYPVPVASFSVDNECQYTELCFNDLSTIGVPDNIVSYIYNFGDASPFTIDQNPCHLYSADGNYTTNLIVNTNNGCVDDTVISLTVYPVPEIDLSATTICVNEPPTVFTNLSTINNPDNFTNWLWSFGDGSISLDENPTNQYSDAGDYTVQLIGITNHDCTDTAEIVAVVYQKPTALITSNIVDSCSIACINFESISTSDTAQIVAWLWNFNNGYISGEEKPSSCFENLSNTDELTYDIGLIATNSLDCLDTLVSEDYITVWHNPIADFEANKYLTNMYLTEIEFYNESTGEDFYDWHFGDSLFSTDENPIHAYADTGSYVVELVVTTIHGCTDTIAKPLRVDAVTNIYAPNTFTPDDDGTNDVFKVVSYNLVQLELLIFDRWGLLIYKGDGVDTFWNGTYKGKESQQDVYIWQLRAEDGFGKKHTYRGHVSLLR